MDLLMAGIVALVSGAFAAGGAWMAVKMEVKGIRRDVDRHELRLNSHSDRLRFIESRAGGRSDV